MALSRGEQDVCLASHLGRSGELVGVARSCGGRGRSVRQRCQAVLPPRFQLALGEWGS